MAKTLNPQQLAEAQDSSEMVKLWTTLWGNRNNAITTSSYLLSSKSQDSINDVDEANKAHQEFIRNTARTSLDGAR